MTIFPNLAGEDLETAIDHMEISGWRKSAKVLDGLYMWNEDERIHVVLRDDKNGGVTVDGLSPADFRKKWEHSQARSERIFWVTLGAVMVILFAFFAIVVPMLTPN